MCTDTKDELPTKRATIVQVFRKYLDSSREFGCKIGVEYGRKSTQSSRYSQNNGFVSIIHIAVFRGKVRYWTRKVFQKSSKCHMGKQFTGHEGHVVASLLMGWLASLTAMSRYFLPIRSTPNSECPSLCSGCLLTKKPIWPVYRWQPLSQPSIPWKRPHMGPGSVLKYVWKQNDP